MKLATSETIRTSRTCSRNRIARLPYRKSDRALIALIDERHYPHIQEVVQHPLGIALEGRPLDPIAGLHLSRELEVHILARGNRYDGETSWSGGPMKVS